MSKFDQISTPKSLPRLNSKKYEKELKHLQAQLVEMQQWVIENNERIVLIFEGRDAAGKGSAIKRITEYLNPRRARIVALPKPTDREESQWYFQRYVPHLPAAGEIVIFDRSWYNRAGVERVMGFCSEEEYQRFLRQAPIFERMITEDGIRLLKYWFSVSDEEQELRFRSRANDPMRRWKLSPMDMRSISRWEDYSRAKDVMFAATDLPGTRWVTVESEDKKRSRINVINDILHRVPWHPVEHQVIEIPPRPAPKEPYRRLDRTNYLYADDVAEKLVDKSFGKEGKKKSKGKKDQAKEQKKDQAKEQNTQEKPPEH